MGAIKVKPGAGKTILNHLLKADLKDMKLSCATAALPVKFPPL